MEVLHTLLDSNGAIIGVLAVVGATIFWRVSGPNVKRLASDHKPGIAIIPNDKPGESNIYRNALVKDRPLISTRGAQATLEQFLRYIYLQTLFCFQVYEDVISLGIVIRNMRKDAASDLALVLQDNMYSKRTSNSHNWSQIAQVVWPTLVHNQYELLISSYIHCRRETKLEYIP